MNQELFKKQNIIRVLSAIIMFLCIIYGYWWVTWSIAIIFLFYFSIYYEIILWGIMYDSLYGISLSQFYNIKLPFTIACFFLFIIAYFLRKRLIIYNDAN